MKSIIYWMAFQMLIGIWLFISPFVLEFREMTKVSSNNMLVGAIVFILGLGVALYEYYHRGENVCGVEQMSRKNA
jgi:hypothetical protein